MNLGLNEEQRLLRDTVGRLFKAECTSARLRAAEETGFDTQLWGKLVELDIPAMRTNGMTLFDAAIVSEEAGAKRSGDIIRPEVRAALANVAVHEKAADMLSRREIWADREGASNPAYGPMAKLFPTEWLERDAGSIVAVAAPLSLIKGADPDLDKMELYMRIGLGSTIHGGRVKCTGA